MCDMEKLLSGRSYLVYELGDEKGVAEGKESGLSLVGEEKLLLGEEKELLSCDGNGSSRHGNLVLFKDDDEPVGVETKSSYGGDSLPNPARLWDFDDKDIGIDKGFGRGERRETESASCFTGDSCGEVGVLSGWAHMARVEDRGLSSNRDSGLEIEADSDLGGRGDLGGLAWWVGRPSNRLLSCSSSSVKSPKVSHAFGRLPHCCPGSLCGRERRLIITETSSAVTGLLRVEVFFFGIVISLISDEYVSFFMEPRFTNPSLSPNN